MQKTCFFSLVLVMAVSIFLFILFIENYEKTVNLKIFSGKIQPRGEEGVFEGLFQRKGNLSRLPCWLSQIGKVDKSNIKTPRRTFETPIPIIKKSSFNKLPWWSFEDMYNLDAPPRPTTCAQSLRNSNDEKFQKAFLPNMRMFLHKDNFNMKEWNRLSHFNSPFGFMEMKYDDVMHVVKLIPKPEEPLLLPKPGGDGCVHCAVVGMGGILNGSKVGAEIDAHDFVFRMYGAVINDCEENVGKRTSVYVQTALSITKSLRVLKKCGYKFAPHDEGIKYILIPEGLRDFQFLQALLKGEKVSSGEYQEEEPRTQFSENRFHFLHQDFLRYVRNRFLRSNILNGEYWALLRPTNGAFTVFLALHTCDTVRAYGFMTEDYNKYSNYYAEKQFSEVIFYVNHNLILEKNLWKSFHEKKYTKAVSKN